ncbi:RIO1 family protein [Colletotrichum graminicola]|uniref:Serine/threonine-protein kinase RIO2 n=1 Tax=Colletotrichum graminicola (strain M1.001 / M2 / FGSC 10212) TaxID=645133 RepID=E3QIH8_COLGM|nr:RIO1 family protein [Colletotrichum graminicola M1.001]EFQ30588.1 RIO1 family protein [Colletotrichum graminicola M1.001]WDK21312.1 RIO1 family protein [Colletotrichum graminicola]
MHLDTKALRHLAAEDWRVLAAVEQGTKNHELVPTPLIEKLSRLRGGTSGVHRSISNLAKVGLIAKVKEAKYDGYRLTYGGLDYLAMHTYSTRKEVYSVGSRVGVGKESDIVMVADERGVQCILKIHRLGRISFRTVKSNRDYLKNKQSGSWMYLSRLAAMKEFAFMKALKEEGFPVPEPIAQNRHTIVMSFIDSFPLRQISSIPDPAALYSELIDLLLRLAKHGLIHGDYNEFNILIKEETSTTKTDEGEEEVIKLIPVVIDFPQMISMDHQNAEMYFDRDVNCIKRFFEKRFHFTSTTPGPFYKDAKKTVGKGGAKRIDATLEASGFTKKMAKDLEKAIQEQAATKGDEGEPGGDEDEEYGSEEDDEEESEGSVVDEAPTEPSASREGEDASKSGKENDDIDTQKFSRLAVADGA